ncbi:type II 3-dehydroquinate dehydratase [Tardiphaga sp.]|jgi:3-dehydroquinate dehydratase-2|uniref:type II 3-dehydroquinate dehydratase n=1 Tax=Tardiphaga sp. TaxID=1926292 RepID=UPI0019C75D31|nr:type II 3-dehydroquinate dehydratase [Tardiphaga sp.]MBC7580710.1 3-dehydroquinate dehydratase [Tardiphaga sp.]
MTKSIAILSGPSLNILGEREPEIYGTTTLAQIEAMCATKAAEVGTKILFFRQSNHEGFLIDWIQEARGKAGGLIINPAGFTSTSIAILDALKTFDGPIMEVHLTNIHKREHFRQPSYVSLAATGVIAGLGPKSYTVAVEALAGLLK